MNNHDKKIVAIFDNFSFISKQPFEIGVCLGVAGFALLLGFIGFDLWQNSGSAIGITLLVLNLVIIVVSIVHIANMQEVPKTYSSKTSGDFLYRRSLQMTRFIQKELISQIDDSKFPTARTQIQKYNNSIRLLSFVVVFEREAYLFIRLPKNVSARRNLEELQEIANDLALELGLTKSSFQDFMNNQNLGLGYISRSKYKVMRLS
ncbi:MULTISPECIES: hypothetical protein [Lactobacillus]|jgi:hypothetical protein|uniref:hypothetical protein n=1 Tax=Lactobacillus TaxID=1578 RepID=UPI0018E30A9B|nr:MULTISPECIES: hypothetical protein [Bacteria]MBI1720214.1 hypothetical protein [Lactobacillus crispatus]MCT7677279.1 hypothetical protein [Lactobacillus iners]MCT7740551.1 hypothetical protein [Lactobacillus crispatus]MCT7745417.1 hypothetical protein [Lactobacillus crispatus]MCT7819448.1 hypothetical protein [Lactobacillus crispatus]